MDLLAQPGQPDTMDLLAQPGQLDMMDPLAQPGQPDTMDPLAQPGQLDMKVQPGRRAPQVMTGQPVRPVQLDRRVRRDIPRPSLSTIG
jgi:hypothetical protein